MRFGKRRLFQNLDISISSADHWAITGPNGSGKSTLLRILSGLAQASKGRIQWGDVSDAQSLKARRHGCGFMAPSANLYDNLTARENLQFIVDLRRIEEKDAIDKSLAEVGLEKRQNDLVDSFSSGMQQRLKLAAAIIHKPKVLLLDEPFANLDEEGISQFSKVIERQRESGAVVVATNNPQIAAQASNVLEVTDFPWVL